MQTNHVDLKPIPELNKHSFLGKKFDIRWAIVPGMLGGCTGRDDKRPVLFLHPKLRGGKLFEVALHEALHACLDERVSEDEVEEMALDIKRFIYRFKDITELRGGRKKG
jgi:hypothetical protein